MSNKDQNQFCRNLAFRVLNAIDRMTVVTPHALVASALLNSGKERVSTTQFQEQVDTLMHYLTAVGATLADTLIFDPVRAVEHVVEIYVQRKFIERSQTEKEGQFTEIEFLISEPKRPLLEYYKNNSISFFVPGAMTALAILEKDAFQFCTPDTHRRLPLSAGLL